MALSHSFFHPSSLLEVVDSFGIRDSEFVIVWTQRADLLQSALEELQPFHRDLVAGRLDATPDRGRAGDDLYVGSERFDHDVALVLDRLESRSDRLPVDVIVAGRAAVAAAGVEMAEQFARLADGRPLEFFLDVHVERVEVQLERVGTDVLDELEALVAGVEKVGLETVERLNANLASAVLSIVGQLLQIRYHQRPLLFLLRRLHGVGLAHGAVNGADE